MYDMLAGTRIVECASFIAAPSCALHLSQLGAEVIRIDTIGGGPDRHRWPLAPSGDSLYWEGLNKGKKSVAIDLSRPDGRELATALITAGGAQAGLFVTNFPPRGFLAHDRLAALRADLITLRVTGWPDGGTALDYTVNAAMGVPLVTGPAEYDRPVNHVLPAWDLLTGSQGATAMLAALRHRDRTGAGQEITLPLADVALAALGHIGQIGEALIGGDRKRFGNDLFGAFGRDFATQDGSRVILVAITPKQWSGLLTALGIGEAVAALEAELGVSFALDEAVRFVHRDRLFAIAEAAVAGLDLAALAARLDAEGACWDVYRQLGDALRHDPRVASNPILAAIAHPSGETYPAPGSAATFGGARRMPPQPAPRLGAHTEEVLSDVLGLPAAEIASLHDKGVIR